MVPLFRSKVRHGKQIKMYSSREWKPKLPKNMSISFFISCLCELGLTVTFMNAKKISRSNACDRLASYRLQVEPDVDFCRNYLQRSEPRLNKPRSGHILKIWNVLIHSMHDYYAGSRNFHDFLYIYEKVKEHFNGAPHPCRSTMLPSEF